ncbi:hypothetical protein CBR_g38924 [Chara braunii]|uniref:Ubiquitin-like protease family profile domain-containing protein n=1 Tax=Chara braunii TaxID=69332 RepID=A0A388K0X6_CHABU|nr:hypothetical protein CBR_g38924 [Chara braunii]|eukprot:GBG63613.1 hypothetical protein CBR_g38924 [Chara braunii]
MPGGEIVGEGTPDNVRRWKSRSSVPTLRSPPVSRLRRFVTLVDRDRVSKRKRNISDNEDSPRSVSKREWKWPRCSSWIVHFDSASAALDAGGSIGVGLQPEAAAHEFAGNRDVPDQETQIGAAHCSLAGEEVSNCRIAAVGCAVPAQKTAGSASLNRTCAVATRGPAYNENVLNNKEGGNGKEIKSGSVILCRRQHSGKSICEGGGRSSSVSGHRSLEDQAAAPCQLDAKAVRSGTRLYSKGFTGRGQTYARPSRRSAGHLEDQGQLLTSNPAQRALPALEAQFASSVPGRSANGAGPSHMQELGRSWKLMWSAVASGQTFNRAAGFHPAASVEGIVGTNPCVDDRTAGMEGSGLSLRRDRSGACPEDVRRECERGRNAHSHGVEGETHKGGGSRLRHRKLKKLGHVRNDSPVVIGSSSPNSSDSDSSSSALARSSSRERRGSNPGKKSDSALQGGFPAGQRNVAEEVGTCAPQSRVCCPQNLPLGSDGFASKASNHRTCDQSRPSEGRSVSQSNASMHPPSSENASLARRTPNGAAMQSKAKAGRSRSLMATPSSSHGLEVADPAADSTTGSLNEGGGNGGGGVTRLQKCPDHYSLLSASSDDACSSPSRTSSPSHDEAGPSTAITRPHPVPAEVSWLSSVSESSEESEDDDTISASSDDDIIQTPASTVLTISSSSSSSMCDASSYDTSSDSGTSSASPSCLWEEFRRKRREAALLGKSINHLELQLQSRAVRLLLGGSGGDSQQTSQDSLSSPLKARADREHPILLLEDGRSQPTVASRSAQQEKHPEGTRTTSQDIASASISGALENLSLDSARAGSAAASHPTWLSQSAQWGIPSSLRQLTTAEQARLLAVWSRGNDRESVSKFMGEDITRKDLATLQGESWINDEVVNFYLATVQNIFDFDILIVPVNKQESHWTLLAVNIKEKALEYYDSFLRSRSDFCYRVFDAMCRYLEDERLDKKHPNTDVDPSRPWRKRLMTEGIPQQEDAGSCGVFMCTFAELLARGYRPPFNFSQSHIPVIRRGIAADILFPGKSPDANSVLRSAPSLPNQNGSSKVPAGAVVCLLDDDD